MGSPLTSFLEILLWIQAKCALSCAFVAFSWYRRRASPFSVLSLAWPLVMLSYQVPFA
jgi:hypothetical protein